MRRAAGLFAGGVLALVIVVAPIAVAAGLGGGGLSAVGGGGSVNGTDIAPNNITISATNFIKWLDHSGGSSYWNMGNNTSALGNIDALGIFRTGGSTPYAWWDFNTGYAVSRFGFAIATANDGSGQRLVPVMHGALTNQAIEHGHAAMTAGSLAVSFADAFGAAPDCTCTHTDTTNANTCTIHVAATGSAVTFAVASGGTDRVDWTCLGTR